MPFISIITANIAKNSATKVCLMYTYKMLFIQSMTSAYSIVCYAVFHTLAPYALYELHTKHHSTGINLV